ncbi:MAG: hypothetical protein ACI835_004770 [Planctomycetota bacterium]|jgi:hypothetical protein
MLEVGARPAIMLTGYWTPTNEMLRCFSDDPVQNPQGWIGSDWEGRGYDVYAYFPEFTPLNCSICGQGSGDLEVDYQDTSADFWAIANSVRPIALITFSRGFDNLSWELEMNQYNRNTWVNDYTAPLQPTPAPPDASVPGAHLRPSKRPVQEIVDAVDAAGLRLDPQICFSGNGGGFLSEFAAYHGVWYQGVHDDPADPDWCVTAGHVHVGGQITWPIATLAAEVTLRTVIDHVDDTLDCYQIANYCTTSPNSVEAGARISSNGPASIAGSNFELTASDASAGQFGLFYYGSGQISAPFGDGFRCVGGSDIFRLHPPIASNGGGEYSRPLVLSAPHSTRAVVKPSPGRAGTSSCGIAPPRRLAAGSTCLMA